MMLYSHKVACQTVNCKPHLNYGLIFVLSVSIEEPTNLLIV